MKEKLEALAALIADYRRDELPQPDADHVGRWVHQFEENERGPILGELHHAWSKLYFSEQNARKFLRTLITASRFTGGDPATYWSGANLLDVQARGNSQREMLGLFREELHAALGLTLAGPGGGTDFVYLDDVLFTGGRIRTDLKAWMQTAPASARVRIVVLAFHRFGRFKTGNALEEEARRLGKKITFEFWRAFEIEDRKSERRNADVLCPTRLPPEVEGYDQGLYPLVPRLPGGTSSLFSSEEARDVVEQAFLKAGLKIRGFSAKPKAIIRPLGYGHFGVGFGSLFLSWRNCPNNAPLALWWGGKTEPTWHPLNKWHPLVPRKTYGKDADF
jgi:hypothetical protein